MRVSEEMVEAAAVAIATVQRTRSGLKVLSMQEIKEIDPIGWERVYTEAAAAALAVHAEQTGNVAQKMMPRVRPLEWTPKSGKAKYCATAVGHYEIGDDGFVYSPFICKYPSYDEALAALTADYEAKVGTLLTMYDADPSVCELTIDELPAHRMEYGPLAAPSGVGVDEELPVHLDSEFQAWASLPPRLPLDKDGDGEYENEATRLYYRCWEAAYKRGVWGSANKINGKLCDDLGRYQHEWAQLQAERMVSEDKAHPSDIAANHQALLVQVAQLQAERAELVSLINKALKVEPNGVTILSVSALAHLSLLLAKHQQQEGV